MEEWRPVPQFPYYEVSNYGRVRRVPSHWSARRHTPDGVLKPTPNTDGYLMVTLRQAPRRRAFAIHRLTGRLFLPPAPSLKHELNHIDGDKTNNHATNLEWVTHAQNMAHASRNGFFRHPAHLGGRKLNEAQMREIRTIGGISSTVLGKCYGVNGKTIRNIWNGLTWAGVE